MIDLSLALLFVSEDNVEIWRRGHGPAGLQLEDSAERRAGFVLQVAGRGGPVQPRRRRQHHPVLLRRGEDPVLLVA